MKGSRAAAALIAVLGCLTGCRVAEYSAEGKRCDDAHPCPGNLTCVIDTCRGACEALPTPCAANDPRCLSTIAGNGPPGLSDGPPDQALFHRPTRLIAAPEGLIVVDTGNHALRLVPLDGGAVTTLAGNGACDELDPRSLCMPHDVARGPGGELYVLSQMLNSVQRVQSGQVTRIIGDSQNWPFVHPGGIAIAADKLVIAGGRDCSLKFYELDGRPASTPSIVTCSQQIDGIELSYSYVVAVSPDARTAFWLDFESRLFSVPLTNGLPSGPPRWVTGDDTEFADGPLNVARFFEASAMVTDANGIFVADTRNHRLRYVRLGVEVSTIAGDGIPALEGARLAQPAGVAVVGTDVYFTSPLDHRIRVLRGGQITAVAGAAAPMQDGCAGAVALAAPRGIARDEQTGNIYFTDSLHHAVRLLTPAGHIATLAGGTPGSLDGTAGQAQFNAPRGVTLRPDGKLVVVDTGNGLLRLVDPASREVTTLVGRRRSATFSAISCSPDVVDVPSSVELCAPKDAVVSASGDLFFTDSAEPGQGMIALQRPDAGRLSEVTPLNWFFPRGIALAPNGSVTIADAAFQEVHEYPLMGSRTVLIDSDDCGDRRGHWNWECDPTDTAWAGDDLYALYAGSTTLVRRRAGVVETIVGTSWTPGLADGRANTKLDSPGAFVISADGRVFIADTGNNRLRVLSP